MRRVLARFVQPFKRRWSGSLMLRMLSITGVGVSLLVIASNMLVMFSVSTDLYETRKAQALEDSARATLVAQRQIDAAQVDTAEELADLAVSVRRVVQDTSASNMVYLRRVAGQDIAPNAPSPVYTSHQLPRVITKEMSASLAAGDNPQYWQAVTFTPGKAESNPGIVVGSLLNFPLGAGKYELYIGYNLQNTQNTLNFIQRSLVISGAVIIVAIAVVVIVMARLAVRPISNFAEIARRLTAGEKDARVPAQSDSHLEQLRLSFNEMADTLQARIAELSRLSALEQRFVSDVSHELRTPLTTIKLSLTVLQGQVSGLNVAQQRAVAVLAGEVQRFEVLLGDLLEISRYDAGKVVLELEEADVTAVVDEEIKTLQQYSAGEIVLVDLAQHPFLSLDVRRLRRILRNLLSNAIEHGEGRKIVVTLAVNAEALAITVRDWGVGIAAADVARVFDRFWRADPSRQRKLGGSGLGLAIAQEDAAVQGGQIDVWSAPGVGSQFRVTLPRDNSVTNYFSPLPLVPGDVSAEVAGSKAVEVRLQRVRRAVVVREAGE